MPSKRTIKKIKRKLLRTLSFNQYITYIVVVILISVWSSPIGIFAQTPTNNEASDILNDFSVETLSEPSFPYTDTFVISAYYSPLPGQKRYATGSYASDIRLNGRGTNGASGAEVNIHMFAAPPEYPFGTKLTCPGIGTGIVQDRGGAIKNNRLDKWMGYGDIGLKRALQYGKRTVNCVVHGIDPELQLISYIDDFSEAEKFVQDLIITPRLFTQDLWFGSTGKEVKLLQEHLTELGYFKDKVTSEHGESTRQAILDFQLDFGVISDDKELGAGHFGPSTRFKLEAILEKRTKENLPEKKLGIGDEGEDVKKLQHSLKRLGYKLKITGTFDEQTADALFRFKIDNNLINSEHDLGSNELDHDALASLVNTVLDYSILKKEIEDNKIPNSIVLLGNDLQFGDEGEEVYRLQEELIRLNYLRIEPTGYYGKFTEHAVFKFQQANFLAADTNSPGAGAFGPLTREALNSFVAKGVETRRLIAEKNGGEAPTILVFKSNLTPGETAEEVKDLQLALKELGYFDYQFITDYYGDVTRSSVLAFQKAYGVIESENEQGAGVFGPKTRIKLSEVVGHSV